MSTPAIIPSRGRGGRGWTRGYSRPWGSSRGKRGWRGNARSNWASSSKSRGGGSKQGHNRLLPPPTPGSSQGGSWARGGSSQPQRSIRVMLPPVSCPYKGWHLYMTEGYNGDSEAVRMTKVFESFIKRNENLLNEVDDKHSFKVHYKQLTEDEEVKEKIQELAELIVNSPQKIISCLGLAAHQYLCEKLETSLREETAEVLRSQEGNVSTASIEALLPDTNLPLVNARLVNLNKITSLKNLKANYYGKLVSLKGTVVRVSSIKPLCKQMAFTCLTCGNVQGLRQNEGKYAMPTSCPEENCQSRSFAANRPHSLTQTVDWQTMRLQEMISDDQREGGRVPRIVECELTEDLVDSCIPGDVVLVTGIVKVNQSEEAKGSRSEKSTYLLYVDANSVVNCKTGNDSASAAGIEFCMRDYYAIEKIQSEKDLFKLLVASLCPAIYGHELVKAGLLLCLFGGCTKAVSDRVSVRGEPHILVVGDPGLGKSQMLQACSNVAPRGVYVCGNTTTTSGLTVTLSKEGGGGAGDYALEGGALVLADQGVCCIDEFDKMAGQHQALLEAMEQQNISIAKAGIVCSLPARTSILAAANPVGGHYNKSKTVAENIKMSAALLSRFDLVFILLDKPDEELDNMLSEHVMAQHNSAWKRPRTGAPHAAPSSSRVRREELLNASVAEASTDKTLSQQLRFRSPDSLDLIPHPLVRKYICYSRKYVHPELTPPAARVLQQFYLELRRNLQNSDSTPITTRQLESLIRLSEARARCELREEVTENDARQVVEIMKFSMIDTYSDEFGLLDFQRSQHGSGTSNRAMMKKFIAALQKLSENTYKSIFTVDEMRQLSRQINLQCRDFGDFLAGLNHQGYLLKKGPKVYQLLTAN